MALKKVNEKKLPKTKDGPKKEPKVDKGQVPKKKINPNIAQAGIMRALKTRDYILTTDSTPYVFEKKNVKIEIHTDKAIVIGTDISIPLGKGAITKLIKQVEKK